MLGACSVFVVEAMLLIRDRRPAVSDDKWSSLERKNVGSTVARVFSSCSGSARHSPCFEGGAERERRGKGVARAGVTREEEKESFLQQVVARAFRPQIFREKKPCARARTRSLSPKSSSPRQESFNSSTSRVPESPRAR